MVVRQFGWKAPIGPSANRDNRVNEVLYKSVCLRLYNPRMLFFKSL